MRIWESWKERRQWDAEHEGVPMHQLRAMAEGRRYYHNPAKQRWLERRVWWRDKIWGHPLALARLGVAIVVAIVGLLGWYGLF
jgi:hypothetical protein